MIQTINTIILFLLFVCEVVRIWENIEKRQFFKKYPLNVKKSHEKGDSLEKCDKKGKIPFKKCENEYRILERWRPE